MPMAARADFCRDVADFLAVYRNAPPLNLV